MKFTWTKDSAIFALGGGSLRCVRGVRFMECGKSLRNKQEKLVCGREGIAMRNFFETRLG